MANLQVIADGATDRAAQYEVAAVDNGGVQHLATGTATIDDYTSAYVVQIQSGNGVNSPGTYQVKPKVTLASGVTKTVTVTFNMIDFNSGVALPAFSISTDLVGPAPAQLATKLVEVGSGTVINTSTSVDPGSKNIAANM